MSVITALEFMNELEKYIAGHKLEVLKYLPTYDSTGFLPVRKLTELHMRYLYDMLDVREVDTKFGRGLVAKVLDFAKREHFNIFLPSRFLKFLPDTESVDKFSKKTKAFMVLDRSNEGFTDFAFFPYLSGNREYVAHVNIEVGVAKLKRRKMTDLDLNFAYKITGIRCIDSVYGRSFLATVFEGDGKDLFTVFLPKRIVDAVPDNKSFVEFNENVYGFKILGHTHNDSVHLEFYGFCLKDCHYFDKFNAKVGRGSIELKNIKSLDLFTVYRVIKIEFVQTKYGKQVLAYLISPSDTIEFKTFLPVRFVRRFENGELDLHEFHTQMKGMQVLRHTYDGSVLINFKDIHEDIKIVEEEVVDEDGDDDEADEEEGYDVCG